MSIRVCRLFQTQNIFLENVFGMLKVDNGYYFQGLQEGTEEIGYKFIYTTVNFADYGIPQYRKRVLCFGLDTSTHDRFPYISAEGIIGNRVDHQKSLFEIDDSETEMQNRVTLWEAIGDLPELNVVM